MAAPPQDWTCPYCGRASAADRPGARCPHDGVVLVPPAIREAFPSDPFLGRLLAGKYALFSVIGKGGFGAVYKAVQEPVDRVVAVKLIRRDIAHRAGVRDRFYREARVVARINHPGAVTLFDYGEDDGVLYMVFEYVEGRPLSEALAAAGGPMVPERAGLIARHLLDALAEAHAQGAVHRDLKPENIMLVAGRDGAERVKVLDFGIAKVMSDGGDDDTLTGADVVLGTPMYMAPEQAGGGAIDGRTDLYAVGVILHQLLAGKPPFAGATSFETLLAHREAPIPALPSALGVPPALAAVVKQALAKDAADRPADARSMARSIDLSLGYTPAPPVDLEPSFDRPHLPPPGGTTSKEFFGVTDNSAATTAPPTAPAEPDDEVASTLKRSPAFFLVGAGVVAAAAAAWVVLGQPPEAVPAPDGALAPVSIKMGTGVPTAPPTAARTPPLVQARTHAAAGRRAQAVQALIQAHRESGDPEGFWVVVQDDPALTPLLDEPAVKALRPRAAPASAPATEAAAPKPVRRRGRAGRRAPRPAAPVTAAPATAAPAPRPARPAASAAPSIQIETF